jgi:uncharacterized membrane protein YqjE
MVLGGIVTDIRQLLRQEFALARCELYDEWRKLRLVLCCFAIGALFVASSVLPLGFAVVWLLHEVGGLPMWGAFALVGGSFLVLGLAALGFAAYQAMKIRVIPPQTAETMKENVEWLQRAM